MFSSTPLTSRSPYSVSHPVPTQALNTLLLSLLSILIMLSSFQRISDWYH